MPAYNIDVNYLGISSKLSLHPGSSNIVPRLANCMHILRTGAHSTPLSTNPAQPSSIHVNQPCCFNMSLTRAASDPACLSMVSSLPRLSCGHLTGFSWLFIRLRSTEYAFALSKGWLSSLASRCLLNMQYPSLPRWILVEMKYHTPVRPIMGKKTLEWQAQERSSLA